MNETGKFVKTPLRCQVRVTSIYTIHYFRYGRNFRFEGETHDFWELVYIDSGSATVVSGDRLIGLKQGEAFFHRPNEPHNIFTDADFANSAIITFDCKSPKLNMLAGRVLSFDDYEKTILNKIVQEAKISYSDKLNEIYQRKMTKRAPSPFGGEQIIKNNMELLILSLIRGMEESVDGKLEMNVNTSSDRIVESICAIMKKRLDNSSNINLDEISYAMGFSKSYIKSQFKKKTGFSVIQYYIMLKMDKAKKLLSQQKYTVSEIADLLGFSSVYYFSRQFKIHTDMSPTEYIKSIKADNVL